MIKKSISILAALFLAFSSFASPLTSPDGKTTVTVDCKDGAPFYTVVFDGNTVIEASPLGLDTNVGDLTKGLTLSKTSEVKNLKSSYHLYNSKKSDVNCEWNSQTYTFSQEGVDRLSVEFVVENNNVAFRYHLLAKGETKCCVINSESTSFSLPVGTTTFLCPQMGEMTGFARTGPSYETHYTADDEMGKNGWGHGYTFPCLFKVKGSDKNYWTLISETGVDGTYCASKIENKGKGLYQISFPSIKENNGYGSTGVQALLPSSTPWRTITVGETLKPIVETTITWDVVGDKVCKKNSALYSEAAKKYGRGSWSWIIANDESCNYETQKAYIDFSAAMGWESLLVDALWDVQIGRDKIAELAKYGKEKGVYLYLWYNSNGTWNDAPQTPRNCMDVSYRRRAEMAWMKSIGIRGIKVDFFGGDKQCTMQLYEDILRDAQEFGLVVIFHGCTLPRGWERMYPNFLACEAVRASENLHFNQSDCDREAKDATFNVFIRNVVGSMDFGGSTLNWYYNPKNSNEMWGGHRITSDVYALATAILFQSPVQHFAMAPNNLTDAPSWAVDFMKAVPTSWDEVCFVDGYPGSFSVLARRTGSKWYHAGVNAEPLAKKVTLSLDMYPVGTVLKLYSDDKNLTGGVKTFKVNKKKEITVTIPCNGGFVICE